MRNRREGGEEGREGGREGGAGMTNERRKPPHFDR